MKRIVFFGLVLGGLTWNDVGWGQQSNSPLVLAANAPISDVFDLEAIERGIPTVSFGAVEALLAEESVPLVPKRLYRIPRGPWGSLEYYVTYLQVPQHYAEMLAMPSDVTTWHFNESSVDEVVKLISENSIQFPQGNDWIHSGEWHQITGKPGIVFMPEAELILSLTPERRAKLHEILAQHPENRHVQNPIVIESGDPLSWYRDAGLETSLAEMIASLSYPYHKAVVFTDVALVLSQLPKLEQRRKFLRAATRTRTLMLRLNVGEVEDFEKVVDYWTNGHKRKAILPILESIAETPGVERIDVAHLLPPTPRKLLFTYPGLGDYLIYGDQDCHWTSINFYRTNPSENVPITVLAEVIEEQYLPVEGTLQFGDIVLIKDPDSGSYKHSAVYIAGDIVYTKNGSGRGNPWVFMRYRDMVARYPYEKWVPKAMRLKEITE